MGKTYTERNFTANLNQDNSEDSDPDYPFVPNGQQIASITTGYQTEDGKSYTRTLEFKEPGFSKIELEFLKQSSGRINMNSPVWKRAFEYYNSYHKKQLGLGCRPCYPKVLQFILNQIPK